MTTKTIQMSGRSVRHRVTDVFIVEGMVLPKRKPVAPWRALYRYCFKLHTLDGQPLTDTAMREWLAENVREHRFEFAQPASSSLASMARWLLAPRPSCVYLVHEEDAILFKLVWGEDIARHRRAVADQESSAVKVLTSTLSHRNDKDWWGTLDRIRDSYMMLDPASPLGHSEVKFEIKKARSPRPSNMSFKFDPSTMVIFDKDRL